MFGIRRDYSTSRPNYKKLFALAAIIVLALTFGFRALGSTDAYAQPQQFALGNVVATISNTSMLDQPASDGATMAPMPVNTTALVIGGPFNEGWYWLDYNGTQGYVLNNYLTIVDDKYTPVPLVTATATVAATSTPAGTSTPVATDTPAPTQATGTTVPTEAAGTSVVPTATAVPGSNTFNYVPGNYAGMWLGELTTSGNVRSGPGLDQPILKGWWPGRRVLLYQGITDSKGNLWYRVSEPPEAPMYVHSSLIRKIAPVQFEGAKYKGKWVNVNLTQQIVTAYEDGNPVRVTLASTGTKGHETTIGVWRIYWRLTSQEMKGGSLASADYYDLPNVPYPQYFQMSGEALHGTYWHDDFGHPHSHGCVNLSTPMSEWLYNWDTIGTIVYVHN